jgi:hypothetical protein
MNLHFRGSVFCSCSVMFGLLVGLISLFTGAFPESACSQEVTASVAGVVVDQVGAALVGATITVTDTERGSQFSTKTNSAGLYSFPRLPIGTYKLKAENAGFGTVTRGPFTLVLNQSARIDLNMQVGNVVEQVNVTAMDVPLLQVDTTEVGTVIDAVTNIALPLASRNYLQLTLLAPGVTSPNPTALINSNRIDSAGEPYVNGNRAQANNYLLDGLDNNQTSDNMVAYSPSPDAIEEFNMITQNASAEFGNFQGGIVNVSTKSGTNAFHGDVWEFFRNDILNANSWYYKLLGYAKPTVRWNMFGSAVGGPVMKDKLFFFVDYQGQRFDTITTSSFNAFTASERNGDFGQLCTDPTTGGGNFDASGNCSDSGYQVMDPYTGVNIPNNDIATYIANNPTSQLATFYSGSSAVKVAQNLFNSKYYPSTSSLYNTSVYDNYSYTSRNPINVDQGDARIDWNIGARDHLFSRFSHELQQNNPVNTLAIEAVNNGTANMYSGVIDWTHTLRSNIVNDVRFGVNWVQLLNNSSATPGIGNLGEDIGITDSNVISEGLPELDFSTATGVGGSGVIQNWSDTIIQANDTLSVTFKRHTLQAGVQILRQRMDDFYAGNAGVMGDYSFGGNFTGNGDSDFYLGMATSSSKYFASTTGEEGEPAWGQRSTLFGAYVQDNWRATNKLNVNIGLRYQIHTPWSEAHGRQMNYEPSTGQPIYPAGTTLPSGIDYSEMGMLLPKADSRKALYNGYYGLTDYQPRIGLAYSAIPNRLVVRAAYTLSDYMEGTGNALRPTVNIPFNIQVQNNNDNCSAGDSTCVANILVSNAVGFSLDNIFANTVVNLWAPNVRPAIAQQWNLSVQTQLTPAISLQVAYVGQHSTHLMVPKDLMQKKLVNGVATDAGVYMTDNPNLTSEITYVAGTYSDGNAIYHALQAVLQHKSSNGLEGQISYAYSHCLTDSVGFMSDSGQAGTASAYWQNLYDRRAEWGSCYFDLQQNLTGHVVYQLPFGTKRAIGARTTPVVNKLISDWQVSAIYTWHGGFPLTIREYTDTSNTGAELWSTHADCAGKVSYPKTKQSNGLLWFDPSNFSVPASGTFGNCGVSNVRGPGENNVDFSVQREFPTIASQHFELRADVMNLFNHPLFDAPQNWCWGNEGESCNTSSLGLIEGSQGERNFQLALKYIF